MTVLDAPTVINSPGVGLSSDQDGNRFYVDTVAPFTPLESVSSVLGATEDISSFLSPWHARLAAEFAFDNHDLVVQTYKSAGRKAAQICLDSNQGLRTAINSYRQEGRKAAINLIKRTAKDVGELKADIGSHQHSILESLVMDRPIPDVPLHLVDITVDGEVVDHDVLSQGLLNLYEDHRPQSIMAEATVAHPELGYAGTLDWIAKFPDIQLPEKSERGATIALDLKAGKHLSGKYIDQIAAYRYAKEVWLDRLGNKAAMPEVDLAAIVHLRKEYPRGYKIFIVDAGPEAFTRFLIALECLKGHRSRPNIKGNVLYPPLSDGSQPYPLIEDIEGSSGFNRIRNKLIKAGILRINELANFTVEEVLAIDGIGDKSVQSIQAQLAEFGLTLESLNNAHS